MAQHKWHKEIKAWADGAEIEARNAGEEWFDVRSIPFWDAYEYRIKPQPKEPQYLYVYQKDTGALYGVCKKETTSNTFKYLGKIKLEVDD